MFDNNSRLTHDLIGMQYQLLLAVGEDPVFISRLCAYNVNRLMEIVSEAIQTCMC